MPGVRPGAGPNGSGVLEDAGIDVLPLPGHVLRHADVDRHQRAHRLGDGLGRRGLLGLRAHAYAAAGAGSSTSRTLPTSSMLRPRSGPRGRTVGPAAGPSSSDDIVREVSRREGTSRDLEPAPEPAPVRPGDGGKLRRPARPVSSIALLLEAPGTTKSRRLAPPLGGAAPRERSRSLRLRARKPRLSRRSHCRPDRPQPGERYGDGWIVRSVRPRLRASLAAPRPPRRWTHLATCAWVLAARFARSAASGGGIMGVGRSWTAWMISVLSIPRR